MDIDNLMIDSGSDIYYNKGFMDTIEAHLHYLRISNKSNTISVDQMKAVIFEGDLFGYLSSFNIEQQYHWIIMRINDLYCNSQFTKDTLSLIIPDKNEIEQIRSAFVSTGSITQ